MYRACIPLCKYFVVKNDVVCVCVCVFQTAVKREVKEESGYDFEPKALIAVEFQSLSWVRFTFVGKLRLNIVSTV